MWGFWGSFYICCVFSDLVESFSLVVAIFRFQEIIFAVVLFYSYYISVGQCGRFRVYIDIFDKYEDSTYRLSSGRQLRQREPD